VDLTQYLAGIGRRWKVIVACLVVALAVGWFLSPDEEAPVAHGGTSFQATTYLLSTTSGFGVRGGSSIDTVAALATLGEVPRRVAEDIGYQGDPATLATTVRAEPDDTTQLLKLTATASTAPRAKLVADTFAQELVGFLSDRANAQVQSLRHQLDRLDQRIARLTAELPPQTQDTSGTHVTIPSPSPGTETNTAQIQAQLDALNSQRQIVQQQVTSMSTDSGGNLAGFEIVEPATAVPVAPDAGIQAPRSRTIRLGIAAAIGLLLGIALALLLERLDTRLRSKAAAEDAYGLPVLAVVPKIGRRRLGTVLTETAPRGPASNAFRLLAAALQFGWQEGPRPETSVDGPGSAPCVILVTSGEPREGKSTVAANLAASFAEVGKRVIVVCCDYRHPTLQATFGVTLEPGLTDLLEGPGRDLESVLQETAVDRVRVIATGAVPARTGDVFGSDRVRDLFEQLRAAADVIVIDTSPVLAASDWTQLIPRVDAVLVVARSGKTDAGSARRTAELLGLLKAPVVGATLNGVSRGLIRQASDRSWYRYQAPDRGRTTSPKAETTPPVVVVSDTNGDPGRENGRDKSHEGIPHLARPAVKE
jgi:capsular exopolysaccharide synthesis family protein